MSIDEERSFVVQRRSAQSDLAKADAAYFDDVTSIRASLEEIASLATCIKRWFWPVLTAMAVAYPTIGKVLTALFQAAGVHQ